METLINATPDETEAHNYRTSNGTEVDLLLTPPSGELWQIEVDPKLQHALDVFCGAGHKTRISGYEWMSNQGQVKVNLTLAQRTERAFHSACVDLNPQKDSTFIQASSNFRSANEQMPSALVNSQTYSDR